MSTFLLIVGAGLFFYQWGVNAEAKRQHEANERRLDREAGL